MTAPNNSTDPNETFRLSPDELKRPGAPAAAYSVVLYARDGVQAVSIPEGTSAELGRSAPADITIRYTG